MQVYVGAFIHSVGFDEPLEIVSNGLIGVNNGKIIFVDVQENIDKLQQEHCFTSDDIYILGQFEFLMPGFVDAHIHASQYPNAGLGLDLPLLQWLETYTFPMESKYSDPYFARSCYKKVVERTLRNGTTTASYYATIHLQSTLILADIVQHLGQRAFVGKVSMDCYSPSYYIESTESSLRSTEIFIQEMQKRNCSRVRPIITPRFALTCSETLMRGLSNISKKYDVHIQTHLCESVPEINRALEIFPKFPNYTSIYKDFGLLGTKSIMAHCVHMDKNDVEILGDSSTGVAHCPTSNICLLSGLCNVRKMVGAGISVGLGTDMSGGYSPSILEAIRDALKTSKVLAMKDSESKQLNIHEVFHLGTLGGAKALGIEKEIGNFQVGKSFDALHIDLAAAGSPIHLIAGQKLNLTQMLEKFLFLGDDRNIIEIFVDGKKIDFKSTFVFGLDSKNSSIDESSLMD